jgi:hypothetical protein
MAAGQHNAAGRAAGIEQQIGQRLDAPAATAAPGTLGCAYVDAGMWTAIAGRKPARLRRQN